MKTDILEQGAIIQRDKETYAIAPHIPGGLLALADLKRLVAVAEKYQAKALKLTSGQRLAIIGLRQEDLEAVWQELQMSIGYAIGLCVRMVKFCPGTTYCRHGKQDAVGLGRQLDRLYHGYPLPAKFKIGVAGCEYNCAAPLVKEIGLTGTPEGWTLTAGGSAGARPRFGDLIAQGLNDAEALALVDRIMRFAAGVETKKVRLGRIMDKIGLDEFKRAIGMA
ncbi:MAG: NAD(P)/FAD-dependent oxidoreductase [Desulfobacca sp.]|uniref:NAD(P)/FAD-dependent oxidoreductase n=1 Tax=Desulfobacca sp. TaxID=2067990 RepID=UPI00404AA4E6